MQHLTPWAAASTTAAPRPLTSAGFRTQQETAMNSSGDAIDPELEAALESSRHFLVVRTAARRCASRDMP
jgi:hypothetical protein